MWKAIAILILVLIAIGVAAYLSCDVRAWMNCIKIGADAAVCRQIVEYTCR